MSPFFESEHLLVDNARFFAVPHDAPCVVRKTGLRRGIGDSRLLHWIETPMTCVTGLSHETFAVFVFCPNRRDALRLIRQHEKRGVRVDRIAPVEMLSPVRLTFGPSADGAYHMF